MQFYDATNKSGLCQMTDFLCDSNDTSYPRLQKTREANNGLDEVVGKIINTDGTWQFHDTNYTDNPVGTGDLVEGQSSYSFAEDFLDIENIKIKDVNGYWNILKPIDQRHSDTPLEDYLETDGMPEYYDMNGDTIRLYPAPSATHVTLTAGIKVQFKMKPSAFTYASTTAADTKEPGFALHHQIIAYYMAIPYCMKHKKDRVGLYEKKKYELLQGIIEHYSSREKDQKKNMEMDLPCNFR